MIKYLYFFLIGVVLSSSLAMLNTQKSSAWTGDLPTCTETFPFPITGDDAQLVHTDGITPIKPENQFILAKMNFDGNVGYTLIYTFKPNDSGSETAFANFGDDTDVNYGAYAQHGVTINDIGERTRFTPSSLQSPDVECIYYVHNVIYDPSFGSQRFPEYSGFGGSENCPIGSTGTPPDCVPIVVQPGVGTLETIRMGQILGLVIIVAIAGYIVYGLRYRRK